MILCGTYKGIKVGQPRGGQTVQYISRLVVWSEMGFYCTCLRSYSPVVPSTRLTLLHLSNMASTNEGSSTGGVFGVWDLGKEEGGIFKCQATTDGKRCLRSICPTSDLNTRETPKNSETVSFALKEVNCQSVSENCSHLLRHNDTFLVCSLEAPRDTPQTLNQAIHHLFGTF